jgi:hypothetical protein
MRRLPFGIILVLVAGVLAPGPTAQNLQSSGSASAGTGLLMGVIVDPLDGQAVPNAEVTLGGAPPTARNTHVFTDAEGRFVFMDLPKGVYAITARKPGYAEGAYGRRRPAGLGQAIALADAERLGDLRVSLWKHAAITGRVTDEAGEPMVAIAVRVLSRAFVAGRQKFVPGAIARTDDRGVYRLASLTPGEYAVVVPSTQASLPDAVIDLYRLRLAGPLLKPGESDVMRDLQFSAGTQALNIFERYAGTRAGTVTFLSTGGGSRAGVPPMPAADGRIHVYPTRYYPAAAIASDATTIVLRSGEERAGVDVQLTPAATSRVSGTVTGPDGPLMAALSLVPDSDDLSTDASLETATTLSDSGGRFMFVGVPEGRHRLRAIWMRVPVGGGGSRGAPPPPAPGGAAPTPEPLPTLGGFTLWATQTVTVGAQDISDLAVTVRTGFRISGRTEFTGGASQPAPELLRRMSATFDPADARPLVSTVIGRGQFDEHGRLSSYQLPPGRYYVRINNVPPGWTLKSATVNGRDVSNVPLTLDRDVPGLTVTFTDRPASLSGQVHAASGDPDSAAVVLLFPADPGAWADYGDSPRRLRAIRVDRQGQYITSHLPAGDYLLVAVAEESSGNWQDPAVLKALSRLATSIALAEGESRSVPLKTSAVAR